MKIRLFAWFVSGYAFNAQFSQIAFNFFVYHAGVDRMSSPEALNELALLVREKGKFGVDFQICIMNYKREPSADLVSEHVMVSQADMSMSDMDAPVPVGDRIAAPTDNVLNLFSRGNTPDGPATG